MLGFNKKNDYVEPLLDKAREYIGYRARPLRVSTFGSKLGVDGKPWDGSFLEVVLREQNLSHPSLINTTAALASYTRQNLVVKNPLPGDLVFFAWSADDDGFGAPHVGLVSDIDGWIKLGKFRAIEAMITPGTSKGHRESDGVYERTRFKTDVLAIVHPNWGPTSNPLQPAEGAPLIRIEMLKFNNRNHAIGLLQYALHHATGMDGFDKGKYDVQTRAAVSAFQRDIGHIKGDGFVDELTLDKLAQATYFQFFRVAK